MTPTEIMAVEQASVVDCVVGGTAESAENKTFDLWVGAISARIGHSERKY